MPIKNCLICQKDFRIRPAVLKLKGKGRFCSHACHCAYRKRSMRDRFFAQINKNGGFPTHVQLQTPCWLWTGVPNPETGYGTIAGDSDPMQGTSPKYLLAHRASWVLHFGGIPDGGCVLHKCDNRICVNPDHLFLGDRKVNAQDCITKGRWPRNGRQATLTEDQARTILSMKAVGKGPAAISKELSLKYNVVYGVWSRRTWVTLG